MHPPTLNPTQYALVCPPAPFLFFNVSSGGRGSSGGMASRSASDSLYSCLQMSANVGSSTLHVLQGGQGGSSRQWRHQLGTRHVAQAPSSACRASPHPTPSKAPPTHPPNQPTNQPDQPDQTTNQLTNRSWPTNQWTNQPTNQPTSPRASQPTNQSTDQSVPASQPASQPTNQQEMTNQPTNQPTNKSVPQKN